MEEVVTRDWTEDRFVEVVVDEVLAPDPRGGPAWFLPDADAPSCRPFLFGIAPVDGPGC